MRAEVTKAYLVYEVGFISPAFELAKSITEALAGLYNALSKFFPGSIGLKNLQGYGGNAMSDVRIVVQASETVLIELFVDRLVVSLFGVHVEKESQASLGILQGALSAVAEVLPNTKHKVVTVRYSTWLSMPEMQVTGVEYLRRFTVPDGNLVGEALGLNLAGLSFRSEFVHPSAGWQTDIRVEPSALAGSHIFLQCGVQFQELTHQRTLNEKFRQLSDVVGHVMAHYELGV